MNVWTVISVGDGEAHSAWIVQNLAWESALALSERICARLERPSMANIFARTRVRTETEGYEIVVETMRRRNKCQPERDHPEWEHHATIRVTSIEIQGDVVSALAKVSK